MSDLAEYNDLRGSTFVMGDLPHRTWRVCSSCARAEFPTLHKGVLGYCRFFAGTSVTAQFGCRAHLRRLDVARVSDPSEGDGTPCCDRCSVEQITHVALDCCSIEDNGETRAARLCETCANEIGTER